MMQRIHDGGVLILSRTPSSLPGAEAELERIARDFCGKNFVILNVQESTPCATLLEAFPADLQVGALLNAHGIAGSRALANWCVLLSGVGGGGWSAWRRFLIEFQHACRELRPEERGTLCCILDAEEALNDIPSDINLTLEHLDSWVSEIDVLELALHRFSLAKVPHPLLLARIAAAIAIWDIPLLLALIEDSDSTRTHDPVRVLLEMASIRGWGRETVPTKFNGGQNPLTGIFNSCFLALDDPDEELTRRIWTGQVGYFLPLIENQRRQVLPELARHIPLPVTNSSRELCHSLLELEVGEICYQLNLNNKAPRKLREKLNLLRQCRNTLAHLEPLHADDMKLMLRMDH